MEGYLIDSHAHVADAEYDQDRQAVLERARAAGVRLIMNISYDRDSSLRSLDLADRENMVYAVVGYHPHDAESVGEDSYQELRRWCQHPKVRAIGEIGLDYYRDLSPRDAQDRVFRRQLALAKELGLPVVIHDRDAHEDLLRVLREEGAGEVGGVMHCFSGDEELAQRCLDLGFHIGLGGPVTFKNGQTARAVARMVPDDRLLVETDSPYLAPVPYRGRRNEPAHVRLIAEAIAALRGVSLERLAQVTSANARRLFRLPAPEEGAK